MKVYFFAVWLCSVPFIMWLHTNSFSCDSCPKMMPNMKLLHIPYLTCDSYPAVLGQDCRGSVNSLIWNAKLYLVFMYWLRINPLH